MSIADRDKWDRRYREGGYAEREHPTALLEEWEARLPRGLALDVACGAGRNSLYLGSTGRRVHGVDISRAGLERARARAAARALDVRFTEADLEEQACAWAAPEPYDLIVLVRYVNRPLLGRLAAALADGGHLLVEQHLVTSADVVGPSTPEFRYAPNELLRAAVELPEPALRILFYRESIVEDPDGRRAALAQLVACRGRPPY